MRTPEGVILEELQSPERLMYLSFADDTGFLGAVIVSANGVATAALKCWELQCNPGGEVLSTDIPDDFASTIPEKYKNRILSRKELEEAFGPCVSILGHQTPLFGPSVFN